jgi:hypothetical protein
MKRGRMILGAAALVRLAYGVGALTAPDWMARAQIAPDVRGQPEGRMDFRGFGALHLSVALCTLRAAIRGRECRTAGALNLSCDVFDTAVGLLEWRDRGGPDRVVLGSLALSVTAMGVWTAALRSL